MKVIYPIYFLTSLITGFMAGGVMRDGNIVGGIFVFLLPHIIWFLLAMWYYEK